MPRKTINDYVFYKIVNINGDVDLCYVGSTANWKERQRQHRYNCAYETKKHTKLYKTIRENGGWNEFKMVEIGRAEQLTKREAEQREEEYRVGLKANMNTIKCFTCETQVEYFKQYNIDNVDKVKEVSRQYYIKNIESYRKKHTCLCGGIYTYSGKYNHLRTQKHQKYIQSINPDI